MKRSRQDPSNLCCPGEGLPWRTGLLSASSPSCPTNDFLSLQEFSICGRRNCDQSEWKIENQLQSSAHVFSASSQLHYSIIGRMVRLLPGAAHPLTCCCQSSSLICPPLRVSLVILFIYVSGSHIPGRSCWFLCKVLICSTLSRLPLCSLSSFSLSQESWASARCSRAA